jgi:ubiquinone/menaquinone biosynthesis C-methylase UbiE
MTTNPAHPRSKQSARYRPPGISSIELVALAAVLAITAIACGGQRDDANRLSDLMRLRPGEVVADVGAGKGEMALAMAEKVGPSGRVFATEIDPERLEQIAQRTQSANVENVTVVKGGEHDTALPPDCCDAIYMRGVYHHLTDPNDIDASLYRSLKPGGELAVLDFRPTWLLAPWTPKSIPANRGGHGVPPAIVTEELSAAGFKLEQTVDPWPGIAPFSNYCLLFRKPTAPAAAR